MNIGIVTTWFERGSAYVSKQFEEVLSQKYNVFIYARGGEEYAIGDPKWDKGNVTWGKKRKTPFATTTIDQKDFFRWLKNYKIEIVIFNEQSWWLPILWCNDKKIPTIAYIDYYKNNTIPFFEAYTALICNTKKHYSAFKWHDNAFYLPWGTDTSTYKPLQDNFKLVNDKFVTFFNSAGFDPKRKGTDILIKAAYSIKEKFKVIIHTQVDLCEAFPELENEIGALERNGRLEIINKTVPAPGLFYKGDIYVYPSRLDGIGLTVAEAEASGLVPVVTNNSPMNEFVNKDIGFLIEVSIFYSREDGYYWPECLPSVKSLKRIIVELCVNKEKIESLKKANYQFAKEFLDWGKNSKQIFKLIENIEFKPIQDKVRQKMIKYEYTGIKKFNKIYLKYYWFMNSFYKLFKKIF